MISPPSRELAMRRISAAALVLIVPFAASAASPEAEWKDSVAGQNQAYAQAPHAMLKIQDSTYIGEGQTAVLTGHSGQPGSWKWSSDAKSNGALRVSLKGGKLSVALNGKPVDAALIEKSIVVDKDVDVRGQPTQVGANVMGWRIFVYNQQHPAAKSFTGVSYYPYDPGFIVTARFVPDARLPPRVFRTSRGTDKQFFHAGDAVFTLKGQNVALPFYTGSNKAAEIEDMSAFFTDALTGNGAYAAGRYVDVAGFGKFPPARITIDFNYAYNPNCARSPHYTCPLATDAVKLAVRAGERDPHAH
jgi:hypothetical protein